MFQLIIYSFLLSCGQILFKLSSKTIANSGQSTSTSYNGFAFLKHLFSEPYFPLGCMLYAALAIYYIILLKNTSLSITYPVTIICSIMFTIVGGYMFFGESITVSKAFASLFFVAGIVIIASEGF